jgi:hypothetical protein
MQFLVNYSLDNGVSKKAAEDHITFTCDQVHTLNVTYHFVVKNGKYRPVFRTTSGVELAEPELRRDPVTGTRTITYEFVCKG